MSTATLRSELGDYSSIICFRAVITGLESVMGKDAARGNLIRAGRLRGIEIAKKLGLSNADKPLDEITTLVANAIGKDGTKLCHLEKIELIDNGYRVFLSDTICSAGEEPGSDTMLSFTQGAVQGVLEEISGHRLFGKQSGSVLRGQEFDIIDFDIR